MTLYDEGAPERLWHYTSGSAAKSIFQSKTLWAGHLGFMNDKSEVSHALMVSRDVAEGLVAEFPEHEVALQRWRKYVTEIPSESSAPNIFAVSFSEERDLLSQWRGYATGAGGPFSIGFPTAMLQRRIDAGEGEVWTLRKCIYSRDEQANLIEARIRRGLGLAAKPELLPPGKSLEKFGWDHIFGAVMNVAPLCKHPDFAEEKEWRLLFGPVDLRDVEAVHFVERRHTLAPYIEFALVERDENIDDIRWIAGPGPQQQRANSALGMVARVAGMQGYQGGPSHTPYLP